MLLLRTSDKYGNVLGLRSQLKRHAKGTRNSEREGLDLMARVQCIAWDIQTKKNLIKYKKGSWVKSFGVFFIKQEKVLCRNTVKIPSGRDRWRKKRRKRCEEWEKMDQTLLTPHQKLFSMNSCSLPLFPWTKYVYCISNWCLSGASIHTSYITALLLSILRNNIYKWTANDRYGITWPNRHGKQKVSKIIIYLVTLLCR